MNSMKFCYCDESGMGGEPIAVMVGVVVDGSRMHLTKEHWQELLNVLSGIIDKPLSELHTHRFYRGAKEFSNIDGKQRSEVISVVFNWLKERRHHVVYSSLIKEKYDESFKRGNIPDELNTIWRFLGFHLVLAMQRYCQKQEKHKGHTLYIFDNRERDKTAFTDIVLRPPKWSDEYYDRTLKQLQLDQLVDVPYFGDSKNIGLIQLADFCSFFLRRYIEIHERLAKPKYEDEPEKLSQWIKLFSERSIGRSHIYPRRPQNFAQSLFFEHAPDRAKNL